MRTLLLVLLLLTGVAASAETEPPSQLAELLGGNADPDFTRALGPREFTFPADHGPHPDYRNEWWYLTGNLDSDTGRRFGFELTVFRFALAPTKPASSSDWRTNQVYIAHLAVTDADDGGFHVAQRYSRGALGLAGAETEPFRVWVDDWRIVAGAAGDRWQFEAGDEGFGITLAVTPVKSPVLNGNDGLSQKSADPGNASYYYSITRLETDGVIRIGQREYTVSGQSWLDREWSTSALASNQVGWDWFALQLDDGSELMFYQLRKTDGSADPASAGTFVDADGVASHLDTHEVEIEVLGTWISPEGGTYPARWRLRARQLGLEVTVTPVIANQELFTTVRYWEGAVDVEGKRVGTPVSGRGYVELTGYAD
jgi:predicted secreted hydrolase